MGEFGWKYFGFETEEAYVKHRRKLEDEGQLPVKDGNRGVVYVYKVYDINAYDGTSGEWTGEYVEQRWAMGKAPDRQIWDYGRVELRRVYTAPAIRIV
jgi:hypothetical protein